MKRSILGSRVYAPGPTEDGAPVTGVVQAVKQENRDAPPAGGRRSVYTVLLQDGSLKEFAEEEIATGWNQHSAPKAPLKSSLKVCTRTVALFCSIFPEPVHPGVTAVHVMCWRGERLERTAGGGLRPSADCHDAHGDGFCAGQRARRWPAQCCCGLVGV